MQQFYVDSYCTIFLYRYLVQQYEKLRSLGRGAQQANLNLSMIKNYKIMYPPIDLQNQFAEFVQQVDKSKLELQQTILNFENTVKSLMKKYIG